MLTLQIIETAYRATLEEQDDPVVWITHAMRGAGAQLAVLLRGNAVNYAVAAQNCAGLQIGEWRQTQPPRLGSDLQGLMGKGVAVHAVAEDLAERGIGKRSLVEGVQVVSRAELGDFIARHSRLWHW